jgi:hypothetical protein
MQATQIRAITGAALDSSAHDDGLAAIKVVQASHGLVAGDLVYTNAGTLTKAIATSEAALAASCVLAVSGDTVYLAMPGGIISLPSHGYGYGALWLSQSAAGEATASKPGSGLVQPVLYAWTADLVQWIGTPAIPEDI